MAFRFLDAPNRFMELTAECLRELMSYDPATGVFRRLTHMRDKQAGNLNDRGYRVISIGKTTYKAHRLAWLYMTGSWPTQQIDHRNGVKDDNAWHNLREASNTFNMENIRQPYRNNKFGLIGVSKGRRGHIAGIQVNGVKIILGREFETPEAANHAYLEAKRKLHEGCTL